MPRYTLRITSPKAIAELVSILTEANIKLRYFFRCKRGRCKSFIDCDKTIVTLLSSITGVSVRQCLLNCNASDIVLPPPLGRRSSGGIAILPNSLDVLVGLLSDGSSVGVSLDSIWRHIGIFGSTGTGKSHTAAFIVRELAKNDILSIVIDWHGEYLGLFNELGTDFTLIDSNNLPRVSLITENLPLESIVEILKSALGLSSFQAAILQLLLGLVSGLPMDFIKTFPTIFEKERVEQLDIDLSLALSRISEMLRTRNSIAALLEAVVILWDAIEAGTHTALYKFSRAEREVWAALFRRLQTLSISKYSTLFRLRGSSPYKQIITSSQDKRIVVLDLSGIANPWIKKLYTVLLIGMIFDEALHYKEINTVIVVEEAHNIYNDNTSLLSHILAEARKYKLGFIIIAHSPSLLPPLVLANINTMIVHRLSNPRDLTALKTIINMAGMEKLVTRLVPGEAILFSPDNVEPVVVKIPYQNRLNSARA